MRPLSESLMLFKDSVVTGTINAPDNYPEWDTKGYETHRADLLALWSEIKPRIRRDVEKAEVIDAKLAAALASFDKGAREPGQGLMVEIYNLLNLNALK